MIRQATHEDLEEIRAMLREYAAWLHVDLCFQNFEQELAGLPGQYALPRGRLLIAEGAGCVALRPLEEEVCEMKRLFVRPAHRGLGLGRRLVVAIIEEARAIGYERMRVDTLPQMGDAQRLYEGLGFRDIAAYCHNPEAGARFMERELEIKMGLATDEHG
jgi:N-acetylglutamate synthase-like GNAT family acetyltransferase